MTFKKAKKYFFVIILTQITFVLIFYFLIDKSSDFSEINVRDYSRSGVIQDTAGRVINVSLSDKDEWCVPIALDKMGNWTAKVVISLEDKRFYEHNGIDILAIARAASSNLKAGHTISVASTMTSQLIRIARPRERTF